MHNSMDSDNDMAVAQVRENGFQNFKTTDTLHVKGFFGETIGTHITFSEDMLHPYSFQLDKKAASLPALAGWIDQSTASAESDSTMSRVKPFFGYAKSM